MIIRKPSYDYKNKFISVDKENQLSELIFLLI